MERIREAAYSTPLLDGHSHNLVDLESELPLLRAFTEADGEALEDARHTLSFKRSVRDVADLYGVEASLESIDKYRKNAGLEAITKKCFEAAGITTVLLDDGLFLDKMKELKWHQNHVPVVRRVLRLETLAESILKEEHASDCLETFTERYVSKLKSLSAEGVIAFKSIAAYRSGLSIDPNVASQDAQQGLMTEKGRTPLRIVSKALVDFLLVRAMEVACTLDIPVQLHTGFGDKMLDLRLANPLHLRPLLEDERFKQCRLVLLHASYPFVQEASYLATVYKQVYLDFGLAVPKLSVRGMENTVSQLLELAPVRKIMFSTDGYAFPETFYLGAKRSREVLAKVFSNTYADGDLSAEECSEAIRGVFLYNASGFYKLQPLSDARKGTPKQLLSKAVNNRAKHVRLLWSDISGHRRCRVVPIERFDSSVVSTGVGLVKCCMAMPAGCDIISRGSGLTSSGEIRLVPDLSTRRSLPWHPEHDIVLGDMHSEPGARWELCPRATLLRILSTLEEEFGLGVRAGFEAEFYLLRPSTSGPSNWIGIDTRSYCSSRGFDAAADILDDMFTALTSLGVEVEQMHAEAGKGQYEICTTHYPAARAADNVLLVRETVTAIARKHNVAATFLPKYFENDLGSASHVHLSLIQNGVNKLPDENSEHGFSTVGEHFLAGVLHHLPSILVFTAPHPNSFARLRPNTWSGAFQCWGNNNREVALRAVCSPGSKGVNNFELKAFDGMANPHLGLAAIIAAGIDGLRKQLRLPKGVDGNPADLPKGTVKPLPNDLSGAVEALESNETLKSILGSALCREAVAVRREDINLASGYKKPEDMLNFLVEKY